MKEREEATPPDGKASPANEETTSSDEEAAEDDKYGKYVEFLLDLLSFF